MTISQQFTPEEQQQIINDDIKQFRAIWRNKKGKSKEKSADTPEALYYYEYKFGAEIYIDTKYEARKRLQRILKTVLNF